MPRILFTFTAFLAVIIAAVYQFFLKDALAIAGVGRVIEHVGNRNCHTVPELEACEKVSIHQKSGLVYAACSKQESRIQWIPAVGQLNASGAGNDYIATYDKRTNKVTRLTIEPPLPRGLSAHGMDVVPSSANSDEVFVYLVNHRRPLVGNAKDVGADSCIEIFRTTVGSSTLTHLRTVEDPNVIIGPNDIAGTPDGKSFHFTNDKDRKTGYVNLMRASLFPVTTVGYCHVDEGCKIAMDKLYSSNGIVRADNDTFYVASGFKGGVTILEKQADDTLVLAEHIPTDRGIDNLSISNDGMLWAAGLPKLLSLVGKHFKNPSLPCPSSALRISINTGPGAFYGARYKVEKVFEDDGVIASGATTAAYDSQRKLLYMTGIVSPHLAVCEL